MTALRRQGLRFRRTETQNGDALSFTNLRMNTFRRTWVIHFITLPNPISRAFSHEQISDLFFELLSEVQFVTLCTRTASGKVSKGNYRIT